MRTVRPLIRTVIEFDVQLRIFPILILVLFLLSPGNRLLPFDGLLLRLLPRSLLLLLFPLLSRPPLPLLSFCLVLLRSLEPIPTLQQFNRVPLRKPLLARALTLWPRLSLLLDLRN